MFKFSSKETASFCMRHSLWLSLLLHLLFLFNISILWLKPLYKKDDLAPSYLPAYTYSEDSIAEKKSEPVKKTEDVIKPLQDKPVDPNGLLPKKNKLTQSPIKNIEKPQPKTIPKENFKKSKPISLENTDNPEAMHLIGETKIIKPLIKILASAISKHLYYPRSAAELGLAGTVLIGFTLHPEGTVTDAKVVKSSGAGVLDDAAREAIQGMSPVLGVSQYVLKPERMVVGIVFS